MFQNIYKAGRFKIADDRVATTTTYNLVKGVGGCGELAANVAAVSLEGCAPAPEEQGGEEGVGLERVGGAQQRLRRDGGQDARRRRAAKGNNSLKSSGDHFSFSSWARLTPQPPPQRFAKRRKVKKRPK